MRVLLRWLAGRPLRFLHVLGAGLGWLAYWGSTPYRQRLDAHARAAGLGRRERRAAIAEAGRLVAELPRLWLRPAGAPIADPLEWEGTTWFEERLAEPRGLLLLTPHLGGFEVSAQAYAERYGERRPITVLFRPARRAWLRELEARARERPHLRAVPATQAGVRELLRALRRGEAVGLLPDQVPAAGQGVWAPFFGRPAYTMTLAARLAQRTGAAVGVAWTERLSRGAGYRVHVLPLPVPFPAADPAPADPAAFDAAAARALNRSMELLIGLRPTQYLWGYHRYKTPKRAATR